MNGYQGPLWITVPGLSGLITERVAKFAADRHIQHEVWYHDEPVWLLWEEEEAITRQVEIAAFAVPREEEQLFFIPDAYYFDEKNLKVTAVDPNRVKDDIFSRPLKSFDPQSDSASLEFRELLGAAWDKAVAFNKDDLKYPPPPMKIPPRPKR